MSTLGSWGQVWRMDLLNTTTFSAAVRVGETTAQRRWWAMPSGWPASTSTRAATWQRMKGQQRRHLEAAAAHEPHWATGPLASPKLRPNSSTHKTGWDSRPVFCAYARGSRRRNIPVEFPLCLAPFAFQQLSGIIHRGSHNLAHK